MGAALYRQRNVYRGLRHGVIVKLVYQASWPKVDDTGFSAGDRYAMSSLDRIFPSDYHQNIVL